MKCFLLVGDARVREGRGFLHCDRQKFFIETVSDVEVELSKTVHCKTLLVRCGEVVADVIVVDIGVEVFNADLALARQTTLEGFGGDAGWGGGGREGDRLLGARLHALVNGE